jgi:hypothetical protein
MQPRLEGLSVLEPVAVAAPSGNQDRLLAAVVKHLAASGLEPVVNRLGRVAVVLLSQAPSRWDTSTYQAMACPWRQVPFFESERTQMNGRRDARPVANAKHRTESHNRNAATPEERTKPLKEEHQT